ncbi:MAG: hypothetical protein KDC42_07795 [Ignavibacteriae bacterium]|nr:hypothetical protein [Ignavibacteriota bacterium]
MKRFFLVLFVSYVITNPLYSQTITNPIYDAIKYRGLTPGDISIPLNFSDTTATNNNRLLLPIVERLMKNPLEYDGWVDSVATFTGMDIDKIFYFMFQQNGYYQPWGESRTSFPHIVINFDGGKASPSESINGLLNFVKEENEYQTSLLSKLTEKEKTFLRSNILSIISEDNYSIEGYTTDIFKYNIVRDSSTAISKYTMDLLTKLIYKKELYWQSYNTLSSLFGWYNDFIRNKNDYIEAETKNLNTKEIKGDVYEYYNKDGIKIAIGGTGDNVYTGDFDFIIDFGGNDTYNMENEDIMDGNFSCIIDLSGDDHYNSKKGFSLAGGVFSSSFIFDKEGDDIYRSGNVSLGSAICGFGLLYDESGNDIYYANSFSIGAAAFGVGLLVDKAGNDIYTANTYSQGFGMTEGAGAIVDNSGNDSYLINSLSLDMGRYEDHFVSMCQGYGLGLRPYYAGGVGLIIEGGGNDIYATDIFGQGGAYWYGLGAIVDKSGHDKYNSYQYGQGAGIHLAVGILKDYDGWDYYTSNGVSQGCGHDYGVGILDDVKGYDNYSAYSLSQGAGNANGIGILIDRSGRDGYLNKEPGNTRGYGNLRREYGSIGLLADGSGNDFYSVGGLDSTITNKSYWGEGLDLYYTDEEVTETTNEGYKVELSPLKDFYSIEEYFIMAKTIEPRFSLWQKYGEEHLLQDSMETAEHMLTKLGTDDHRETFLMRNMIVKIPAAVSTVFSRKLEEYKSNKKVLNEQELSMMAYLYGETQNPLGKDALLLLTYDDDIRVRSNAVLALGKIKYDPADIEFIEAVSKRLRELAEEKTDSKIYFKNLLYAFNNYPSVNNFPVVFQFLSNDFFGARFLAADALSKYPAYSSFLRGMGLNNVTSLLQEDYAVIAFIYSLNKLTDEEYKNVVEGISHIPFSDAQKYNMIKSLMDKRDASENGEFKSWADEKINLLKEGLPLKVE